MIAISSLNIVQIMLFHIQALEDGGSHAHGLLFVFPLDPH